MHVDVHGLARGVRAGVNVAVRASTNPPDALNYAGSRVADAVQRRDWWQLAGMAGTALTIGATAYAARRWWEDRHSVPAAEDRIIVLDEGVEGARHAPLVPVDRDPSPANLF